MRRTLWAALALSACSRGALFGPVPSTLSHAPSLPISQLRFSGDPKREDLLYVALVPGAVDVFTFPAGKFVSQLNGFEMPNGECVDGKQEILITDFEKRQIVKYAHGGSHPVATFADPGSPWDCSVDSATGNIAVANVSDKRNREWHGDIMIYKGMDRAPKSYTNAALYAAHHCAYDGSGDLFVSGENWSLDPVYLELSKGSSRLKVARIPGLRSPDGIQWDGAEIVVGDARRGAEKASVLYRVAGGRVIGATRLKDAAAASSFWISSDLAVMADERVPGGVGVWKYPRGGRAINRILLKYQAAGVAVSRRALLRR